MAQKPIPWYHGARIYVISTVLFFMLVFPFMIYLGLQNLPRLADRDIHPGHKASPPADSSALDTADTGYPGILNEKERARADSIRNLTDSLIREGNFNPLDSEQVNKLAEMIEIAGKVGQEKQDSVARHHKRGDLISIQEGDEQYSAFDNKGPFGRFFIWFFPLTLLSYLAGLIYNWPFKHYFRLKRKKKPIPVPLHARCKKSLLLTPVYNALIITLPNAVLIIYSFIFLVSGTEKINATEKELFVYFFLLTLLASTLEFLFAYYWQRHRVHMKYLDFVFSEEELRERIFRRKDGGIRNRYLVASGITTLLPLLIVTGYLVLSITPLRDLGLDSLSRDQRELLIGPWGSLINPQDEVADIKAFRWMFYVNAGDTMLMIIGIGNGILVAFIYLILMVRWTNQDITRPVKELLSRMRNTRGGGKEQYAIVRTNDEIGELAEGYNEMTRQILEHLEQISGMNRELEIKVKERTREVVMQKEEIESQKEEIQTQLDLTTEQRDTISRQNEKILDSIRYAQKIQAALLPPVWYLTGTVSDHFIIFKPRDIVSGDYYWTAFREGKLMIAVADCTGHGVPGAFLSILGISAMNEIINRPGSLQAGEILLQLREFLIHTLHQTGEKGEAQDGIEIALCIIDPVTRKVEFAGANRPLYLIRAESKKKPPRGKKPVREIEQIRGDKMPIGIYEQESAPFTNHELELGKGDTFYLFSDGFVDQLGGPRRKTYRSVHLRNLLLEIQDKSMEEQKKILLASHETWRGQIEQIDDILLVGIRM